MISRKISTPTSEIYFQIKDFGLILDLSLAAVLTRTEEVSLVKVFGQNILIFGAFFVVSSLIQKLIHQSKKRVMLE